VNARERERRVERKREVRWGEGRGKRRKREGARRR